MNNIRLSQIVSNIESFPTLPSIVAQVLKVVADPESTAGDLTDVILPDPAMTTSILKVANSAFLGLPKKVATLRHAISIMGFNEIRNLVMARAICQSFKHFENIPKFDLREFWVHSFLSALAAKLIADDVKCNHSEFFVAGLVHDIGKLVIFMVYPEEFCRLEGSSAAGDPALLELERRTFGLGHDDVGLRLARRWFLPPNLAEAAGYHHNFQESDASGPVAIIIHLADLLAHLVNAEKADIEKRFYRESFLDKHCIAAAASHGLKLSAEKLNQYEKSLEKDRQENSGVLQLFIG